MATHCRNGKPFRAPAKPRASRLDTTREPTKSRAFHPLNRPPASLQHVSPRRRVPTASAVPSGARCSRSSAAQRTLSAQEASPRIHHLAQIATTDSVYLQHSNTEVNNHTYCNGAMARGPEDSTTPVRVALVAAHCRNGKPFRAPAKPRAGRPDTTREPTKSCLPPSQSPSRFTSTRQSSAQGPHGLGRAIRRAMHHFLCEKVPYRGQESAGRPVKTSL